MHFQNNKNAITALGIIRGLLIFIKILFTLSEVYLISDACFQYLYYCIFPFKSLLQSSKS